MEDSLFRNAYTQKGKEYYETPAYMALVRLILEYGAVCWDPYREGQVGALNRLQKSLAKFANTDQMGWETLVER
jgi:hypothetical protein